MPTDPGDHMLSGLCQLWIEKIRRAKEHKKRAFQDDADEAMQFYKPREGNYNFVYKGDLDSSKGIGIDAPEPSMRMTLNKVAELVEIFGPLLYAKNPVRQVTPRRNCLTSPPEDAGPGLGDANLLMDPDILAATAPPQVVQDPTGLLFSQYAMAVQQQEAERDKVERLKSRLVEAYLNYTPNELRLKDHAERAIDEALIKGRGCLWTELYQPPGSEARFAGSFFDSVDFLQIDPDAESFGDAWWIARECCHPVWEVERRYGLKPGTLKPTIESSNQMAEVDSQGKEYDRKRGVTNDLCTYYQIYSRMGCGGRLSGSGRDRERAPDLMAGDLGAFASTLDPIVGDACFLVVSPNVDYPLNLPPEVQELPILGDGSPGDGAAVIRQRLAWPVPLHAVPAWPVSVLDFHIVPRSAWPMSHIKPAMGELRFLCWAYSFVAGKIKNTLRDTVAILKELAEEFKVQILEGADLSVVELDTNNRDIRECVQILQYPQMNADVWKVIEAVEANFEKRVGLNEIFYGGSQAKQLRSATEADLKSQHINIRPDDMAERVEAWMTDAARKEAVAARMLLSARDVTPVLGQTAAALWSQFVASTDPSVFRELDYRIEAGSARKPNKDKAVANAGAAMQTLMPVFDAFAMGTGQLGPINALIGFWCKTMDLEPGPFLLPAPPPMPTQPQPAAEPGPEPQPGGPPK